MLLSQPGGPGSVAGQQGQSPMRAGQEGFASQIISPGKTQFGESGRKTSDW